MPWLIKRRTIRTRAAQVMQAMSLNLELDAPVESLSPSDRQQLIIARALASRPRVLILDEPTSTFSAIEATRLYETVRLLARRGVSIIFISHNFDEIEALCGRVVVLRDGRVRGDFSSPFVRTELVGTMLGELSALNEARPAMSMKAGGADVVLSVDGLRARSETPLVSFSVHRGEVVGITGLISSGKTELLEQIFGARPLVAGSLTLNGHQYHPQSPAEAVAAGIAFVPEDRSSLALIPGWSVTRNITLPYLQSYRRFGLMSRSAEEKIAAKFVRSMSIRCTGPNAPIGSLSGGNQQKVVVARWLQSDSSLVILDEPFRGIDIGARHEIVGQLRSQSQRAVIVASSDPEEIIEVADRILVLAAGALVGELPIAEATASRLVHMMAGGQVA